MKKVLWILAGLFLLSMFGKNQTASTQTSASGSRLIPLTPQPLGNVFVDESGDLVTINSTGGTTVLPDPNGIGGGFAT